MYIAEAFGKLDMFHSNSDMILGSLSPKPSLVIMKEPLLI